MTQRATQCASARVHRTILPSMRATRSGVRYDTTGRALRHGQAKPATQRSARAVCGQAGPRVGALCTRLTFDFVHYSESLFGTLFISTVHEVCKKKN